MKTVGVIIPIYNVEKYLKECLDSVINQSYTNLEIILVNDGSTDENSLSIAKEYTLKDKRITLFDKKNGGLSSARNVGIEYFSGEYKLKNKTQTIKENSLIEFNLKDNNPYEIYTVYKSYKAFSNEKDLINFTYPNIDYIIFLDSDDYWELNCIEECVPRMDGVEVVWFDYEMLYDDIKQPNIKLETILEKYKFDYSCAITQKEWLNKMLENKYSSFWFGWHGMIDFAYLKFIKLKFLNQILHEDHYFGKLLFIQVNKIYILKIKLYYYRQRTNSIMTSRNNPTFENTPLYIRKIYKDLNHDAKLVKEFYRSSSLLITACMIFDFTQTHQDLPNIDLFEQIFMQKLKLWRNEILSFPEQYLDFMFENTFQRIISLKQNSYLYFFKFISIFFSDLTIIKNKLTREQIYLNKILQDKDKILIAKENQISNLNKILQDKNKMLTAEKNLLNFQSHYGKAKTRIQNQLSYKLGQALIINSKSVLGFLFLPFIILSIVISHKQEQKAYKIKIKKNPNLALLPLEAYPDYQKAIKEKECFTYKLGEALIKANKTWYKGGYIRFIFEVGKLKKKFKKK
ncbi:glycosyltransferase family 2 protein [Campylobacter coli]|nr:glycosyltransferase family 2 protein [Campylobacter coli]